MTPFDLSAHPRTFYRSPPDERIHRASLSPTVEAWVVSGYEDVQAILKDPRFSQTYRGTLSAAELAALPPQPDYMSVLEGNDMLSSDPPEHTRLRGLVHKAFTPRLIEALRPRISRIAETLLDDIVQRPERQFDFIADFALPLPVIVIAELLGLPPADLPRFQAWAEVLTSQNAYTSPDELTMLAAVTEEFTAYFSEIFEQRRAHPQPDLISALVEADEGGTRLSEIELHAMIMLLLIAGHETTVNLLGNGMVALLEHPTAWGELRASPAVIPAAVEELLRYAGPVYLLARYAKEDIALGEVVFARGDCVMLAMASANRDPHRFADPEAVHLSRPDNRHLSFGQGIHYCLGAPLARLEVQIALAELAKRLPDLRFVGAERDWRTDSIVSGLRALPLRF